MRLDPDEAVSRFAALVDEPEGFDLDVACLLVAAALAPPDRPVDVEAELARLDALAWAAHEEAVAAGEPDGLATVVRHLFATEGFRGNAADYYDADNSLLPVVLDRKLGIPISLAVVTIEVARRLGVAAVGIGMPGHFLVGDPTDPTVFVDAFGAGAVLDRRGVEALFRRLHGDQPFDPAYLEPVGPVALLTRVLANLQRIYARRPHRPGLVAVLRLRDALPGSTVAGRAALGEALAAAGRFAEAADLLDATAASLDGGPGWPPQERPLVGAGLVGAARTPQLPGTPDAAGSAADRLRTAALRHRARLN